MKKAIQFGAGNIGRGFLGQLFSQSNFETVFVEVREDLISLINKKGYYKLKILSAKPYEIIIKNIRAVNAKNQEEVNDEIKTADIMSTSVKSENLASVASLICSGMMERAKSKIDEPINLLLCENLPKASDILPTRKGWGFLNLTA